MNPEVRGQKVAVGLPRACRGGTQGRARSGLICTDVGVGKASLDHSMVNRRPGFIRAVTGSHEFGGGALGTMLCSESLGGSGDTRRR